MMSQRKKDISSSLCLFALGLFLALQSARLSVWGRSGPEAGFFPFVVAVIIIGLSFFITGQSTLSRAQEKEKISEEREDNRINIFRVSSYGILMLLYGISIVRVGFLITSALFLFLILKYVERQSWKITILLGSASMLISYLLFVYLLKVPFPRGFIKW
jgi:putative tricarboxylic transport membrane protein